MGKPNILAQPRGGITINLSKRQAKLVMRAIAITGAGNAELDAVYRLLKDMLTPSTDGESK